MDREVFEQLKEQAGQAREAFKSRETSGINMDGAFTIDGRKVECVYTDAGLQHLQY